MHAGTNGNSASTISVMNLEHPLGMGSIGLLAGVGLALQFDVAPELGAAAGFVLGMLAGAGYQAVHSFQERRSRKWWEEVERRSAIRLGHKSPLRQK